jgi:hypothetical protein
MRTLEQWLKLSDTELALEAAKVLRDEHSHDWEYDVGAPKKCRKCGRLWAEWYSSHLDPCPIPDPIDINDWNVAMEAFHRLKPNIRKISAARNMHIAMNPNTMMTSAASGAAMFLMSADAKHYIIAAAYTAEQKGETK